MRQVAFKAWFRALALVVLLIGAWAGCRCRPAPPAASGHVPPSLRLVLMSGVAGALEPCGCVKDMLGGVDRAAAYLNAQEAAPTLVLGAGPMLFMDPQIPADRQTQDLWKAEALAQALTDMGMRAFAPGANDFAPGAGELSRLLKNGPALLSANLSGAVAGARPTALYVVGGVRVGVVGISRPRHSGALPEGVQSSAEAPALRKSALELTAQGAQLRVALVALPRGEALRLAELVPEFQVMLIGKPSDQGETNDPITPPVQVGRTLVVEAPNHLQAFYVVDLFVKEGVFSFENAAAGREQQADLDGRIQELQRRIQLARANGGVSAADLAAREADLARLEQERQRAVRDSVAPAGSHYSAQLVEVRESLGSDPAVAKRLASYYARVNEHNRVAFADRLPPPAAEGQSSYVGVEQCAVCHQEAHAFWSQTRHARAYETLARQHKQFNLDCVSCHVTGYGEPGGSTVAHVKGLVDVQCENCHGPGSGHVSNPADPKLIVAKPESSLCAPKCHHPPHVKPDWSVTEAWKGIIGPGHGG